MRDTYFLDREGNPLGGKIPLQVYSHGGGDAEAVRAEANGLLNAFLENVRQSIAPNHKRTFDLPGGGSMTITSLWGHVKVDLFVPPTEDEGGPFYGGILINPHVITGDQAAYLSLAGNPTPWRVPDAVKTAGAAPGRPAVPGTGSASTEWLVVQIARDLPLTGNPLASGAVRMFRIANPKFGGFCEVAEPGRYAVSTIDGSAFFLCGQQLDHVPPMPGGLPALTRSSEAGGGPSPSRIRTVGMQPASFVDAHAAEGIIIFALVNQLWALNTRERTGSTPAPWRLLAEVAMPRDYPADYLPNEFGAVFTVSVGASTTITCSGTNGVGACSGFSVTITPTSGAPALSGTLTLVDSGFRASLPPQQIVNFTGTYTRPATELVDSWNMPFVNWVSSHYERTNTGGGTNDGFFTHEYRLKIAEGLGSDVRYVAYKALGLDESHTLLVDITGPTPAIVPDAILGGTMPRRAEVYHRSFSEEGQTLCELSDLAYRLKGAFPGTAALRDETEEFYHWLGDPPGLYELDSTTTSRVTAVFAGGDAHSPRAHPAFNVGTIGGDMAIGWTLTPLSLWWNTFAEYRSYYETVYAPYVFIDFQYQAAGDGFYQLDMSAGEPKPGPYPPGFSLWQAIKMGELYINVREINDRVFIGFSSDLTPAGALTFISADVYLRQYPHEAVARYRRPFDINDRLGFPGITPFPVSDEVPLVVPNDLPLLDDDLSYPDFAPGWTAGATHSEEEGYVIAFTAGPVFDGEFIARYPKRAAVFDAAEHYDVTDTYVGSLLGRSFTATRTRTGRLVANEFLAHMLPTNVDTFVEPTNPDVSKEDDRQVEAGGTYERDPYLRYAYTARDWHCGTMGWRRDAGRTGSWFIENRTLLKFANNFERALLHETADRVEASHTLYRAGGAVVMTFPDLLSFYPLRHLHGPMTPPTTNIVNVAAPYLQHDLLYLDKRFPNNDDCDSFGVFGFGTSYSLDEGSYFFFDTECLPRRQWMPGGPYRAGVTPNRPQLLVGYWGRSVDGGDRDPLFPIPGYWIPNPEPDPPEGEEYVHVPHIEEASETDHDLSGISGPTPDFTERIFLGPKEAEFYELLARKTLTDIGGSVDVLYVDNRTGGFITQVLWSGNGGRISEAYIGNRTGIAPFRPIFDAWLALGGGAAAEGTKIAIDRPPTSIGGPAPGAINPQPVSLL